MYIGPFCALCGGIFKPLSRSQSPLRPDWETLTRIACRSEETDADEAPVVSGLGYYAVKSIRARMNYESTYNDTESPYDLEEHPILIPSARKRVFGFHEVCWQLLLSRLATLGQHEPDPREVGSCLFQVLKSIPWGSAGVLLPDNNYHGTVNLRQNGNGRRLLMADPTQFPDPILYHDDIGEQNKKLPQNPRYDILSALHTHNSSTKYDFFSQLPPEIVQYLIILLPSKDVCSARLSSRHLALNVYEYHLPRRFWASRFSPENEMGFALDLYLPKFRHDQIDWHKTYLDCKSHNQPRPQSRSFQNRRRIWRCVEDFAIIIDRLLQSRQHSQCQILPKDGMVLDPATCSMGPRAVCPKLPATFHYEDNGPLHSGVRLCEFRIFPLQRDADSDTLILQICTTSLSSGVYISGLRALIQPHGSRAHVVQQAGMIVASSLHSMRLLPGDTLTSIDVTISSSGLHGLKFFITKLDGSISEEIFGNINISGSTMAVTKLQSQGGITALIVGFDIWKAGSIQIIELAMTDNFYGVRNRLWNRLWNPTFPPLEMDHPSSSRYINEISNGCQFPVEIYMPFGAQNGSRLASLCGVTAFLYGTFGLFGLQFAYADGTKTLYGRTASVLDGGRVQACVEQNFIIRGPKGERITHLVA